MATNHRDKIGDQVFNVVYTSKEELLDWFLQLYKTKLPEAKVIKRKDHLVVIMSGEIFKVKPNGVRYCVG